MLQNFTCVKLHWWQVTFSWQLVDEPQACKLLSKRALLTAIDSPFVSQPLEPGCLSLLVRCDLDAKMLWQRTRLPWHRCQCSFTWGLSQGRSHRRLAQLDSPVDRSHELVLRSGLGAAANKCGCGAHFLLRWWNSPLNASLHTGASYRDFHDLGFSDTFKLLLMEVTIDRRRKYRPC